MSDIEKRNAARRALEFVRPGMTLGLGTGSTAAHFVDLLGDKVRAGLSVRAVATSNVTQAQAEGVGIPMLDANDATIIDLAVDGADEVDARHHLIKGGGGALLREKIIAAAAAEFVVIVDRAKMKSQLGAYPLPVEITRFGHVLTARAVGAVLAAQGLSHGGVSLRKTADGTPYITDGGNLILDCACGAIGEPGRLARALEATPGVAGHGLFVDMASCVIIGHADGADVRRL